MKLPEGLTEISELCFYESGLTKIVVPQNVLTIGHHAFWGCPALVSIEFAAGSQLCDIADMAFGYVDLHEVVLPVGTKVMATAFNKDVVLKDTNG